MKIPPTLTEAIRGGERMSIRLIQAEGHLDLLGGPNLWSIDVDGRRFGCYEDRATAVRVALAAKSRAQRPSDKPRHPATER